MYGGQRLGMEDDVERAIKLGYNTFKNDMNLAHYMNLVLECDRKSKE
jgi:hypothetical protein